MSIQYLAFVAGAPQLHPAAFCDCDHPCDHSLWRRKAHLFHDARGVML